MLLEEAEIALGGAGLATKRNGLLSWLFMMGEERLEPSMGAGWYQPCGLCRFCSREVSQKILISQSVHKLLSPWTFFVAHSLTQGRNTGVMYRMLG